MTTLMKASYEWSTRPEDQRFKSLEDLKAFCLRSYETAKTAEAQINQLRVEAQDGDLHLIGRAGVPATFTNWSFGQLCSKISAPAGYIRDLPATLAAQNVNHGLAKLPDSSDPAQLYFHNGDALKLHAITTPKYSRIYGKDVVERLEELVNREQGWQPAPAAFDGSRGLYASDHDLFCFFVDNDRRIFEKDKNGGLGRGFFLWNSEVGAASIGIMTFLYEYVCGNHRVWGATGIQELRIRHVGNADQRYFGELAVELRKYSESSATEIEAQIETAKQRVIAKTKDDVLDAVFGKRITGLSRSMISDGYEMAERRVDWYGAPNTVWGLAGGLTEVARDTKFADSRVALDRAAGKLMEINF